jgi:DNA-binding NarL/FixJ family response regulator
METRRNPHPVKKIKILLIQDNRLLRDGIKVLINAQADLKIVAASGGNHDTLLKARSLKAQVVLLDLGLQNENGLQLVKTLTEELPQTKVVGMGLIPPSWMSLRLCRPGHRGSSSKTHRSRISWKLSARLRGEKESCDTDGVVV